MMPNLLLSWKATALTLAAVLSLFTLYFIWKGDVESKQILKTNVESLKQANDVRTNKKIELKKLEETQTKDMSNDENLIRQRRYFDAH